MLNPFITIYSRTSNLLFDQIKFVLQGVDHWIPGLRISLSEDDFNIRRFSDLFILAVKYSVDRSFFTWLEYLKLRPVKCSTLAGCDQFDFNRDVTCIGKGKTHFFLFPFLDSTKLHDLLIKCQLYFWISYRCCALSGRNQDFSVWILFLLIP